MVLFLLFNLFYLVYCRQNAVILILCKNEELNEILSSIKSLEERFNNKYKYPYVFLNDKEFTNEFKDTITKTVNNVKFGKVDPKDWDMPESLKKNIDKIKSNWNQMLKDGVPYADRESYHNMCRFFSRKFYKHPLVASYEYYWRVEPKVKFRCDIDFDPFDFMKENNKKYAFVITVREFMKSITTLMDRTIEFMALNLHRIRDNLGGSPSLRFMYDNSASYNGCHFWSNFEIGSFEFLRSQLYNDYVDFLEQTGGFYYERWGDAPVHSIAASFLLKASEVHFFEKIGYTHDSITHCPKNGKNCDCDEKGSIDFMPYSCLRGYLDDVKAFNSKEKLL